MPYATLETETIYQGRVFDVRKDTVELPDGRQAVIDVVQHNDAVALVPIDEHGQVWFVRQYRHPAGEYLLELPAGVVDSGEEPDQCARREIREEIGMGANEIRRLGQFYLAPGYSSEFMHVYIATGLVPDALDQDDDEFITVEKVPFEQAIEMAANGTLRDLKTIAALFLAKEQRS